MVARRKRAPSQSTLSYKVNPLWYEEAKRINSKRLATADIRVVHQRIKLLTSPFYPFLETNDLEKVFNYVSVDDILFFLDKLALLFSDIARRPRVYYLEELRVGCADEIVRALAALPESFFPDPEQLRRFKWLMTIICEKRNLNFAWSADPTKPLTPDYPPHLPQGRPVSEVRRQKMGCALRYREKHLVEDPVVKQLGEAEKFIEDAPMEEEPEPVPSSTLSGSVDNDFYTSASEKAEPPTISAVLEALESLKTRQAPRPSAFKSASTGPKFASSVSRNSQTLPIAPKLPSGLKAAPLPFGASKLRSISISAPIVNADVAEDDAEMDCGDDVVEWPEAPMSFVL